MTDVKTRANPLFLRDEDLRESIELLFYAYREFTAEPDEILGELGLGRAHHRAIYFVGRYPGITVTDLLRILRITKQSLSRVLSQLVKEGYIEQRTGVEDRRQRLLTLTETGRDLERKLTDRQRRLLRKAFKNSGAEAVEGYRSVLTGMCQADDIKRVFGKG
ncbi:MAG: MarR family transcriptional regulator [Alphaproteobacteria bacterium]|nr:MarR family transcriptional regulator [Alphaproteobacteria bacterium]